MFQDGAKITTVTLANGVASYNTKYKTTGTHRITATYSGELHIAAGSTSATLKEYVGLAPTTTTLTTSGSPSHVGQPVTFTAAVKWTYGTVPDGELVTFFDGTTTIGTGTTATGVATFTTSSLTVKTHTIKAIYAGDAKFKPSSGTVMQVVEKYPTTTTLASSLNPSQFGQAVTFTAHVTSTGPAPTGSVKFLDGTTGIGLVTLSGGVAKLTKSNLAVGSHSITAHYNGNAASSTSTSAVVNQVVQ
jgi:Bacterial Ig-like domain (group 3)